MNKDIPPVNIEAEESILGGILLDPMAISRIEAQLKVAAFFLLAAFNGQVQCSKLNSSSDRSDIKLE